MKYDVCNANFTVRVKLRRYIRSGPLKPAPATYFITFCIFLLDASSYLSLSLSYSINLSVTLPQILSVLGLPGLFIYYFNLSGKFSLESIMMMSLPPEASKKAFASTSSLFYFFLASSSSKRLLTNISYGTVGLEFYHGGGVLVGK